MKRTLETDAQEDSFHTFVVNREVHQGVSKKDGRVVALKRIFMPNEKEGVRE